MISRKSVVVYLGTLDHIGQSNNVIYEEEFGPYFYLFYLQIGWRLKISAQSLGELEGELRHVGSQSSL